MAQPSVNDVLTWDGTKGAYAPNPSLALPLPDTYIYVGNSVGVATGVPLTLSTSPGPFSLADTGILTMPNASASTTGLLSSIDWVSFTNRSWKQYVRLATTGPGNLATDFQNGFPVDSVNCTTGDRILIKDQIDPTENGIYIVQATGAPVRSDDFNTEVAVPSATVKVNEGTVNTNTQWVNVNQLPCPIGTSPIGFIQDDNGTGSSSLSAVLAIGNTTGAQSITSDNTFSVLNLFDTGIALNFIGSGATVTTTLDATQYTLLYTDGSIGGAILQFTPSSVILDHQVLINLNSSTFINLTAPSVGVSCVTNDRVVIMDLSGSLSASVVTITELSNVSGSTSNLQGQIDALVSGLSWKQAVRVRTTANITLIGTQTIDGVSVIVGDRVLVMNQTLDTENGIYVCSAGAWSRSTDANTGSKLLQATVATEEGTLYADQQYVCTTNAPIIIGVSSIAFILVGGTTYVGTTNRITVTGNVIDIAATYIGQTSITTLGTISTGAWQGNIISPIFGGTGIANNSASTLTISGNFATTITVTGVTGITLPTSGKLYGTAAGSISSAQMLASMSDPTGTGLSVFATNPTFVTSITTPLIYGGTAVGSKITLQSTTGVGTTTVAGLVFNVGNNGAINAMNIYNDGQVLINSSTVNPTSLGILRVDQGTSTIYIGEISSGISALWANVTTPSTTNYMIQGNGTTSVNINCPTASGSGVKIMAANAVRYTFGNTSASFTPTSVTSGAANVFSFTSPPSTNQTLSTEINGFIYSLTTNRQWAQGALTTQREFLISAPTYRFATGASTITTAATLAISGAPIAGTNATITNAHALWVQAGQSHFDGDIEIGDTFNFILNATTGTKIATATTQKLGFYNAAPIVQRSGAAQAAVATTASTNASPYGYTTSAQADAIITLVNELRAWAVAQGFIKGSA